MKSTKTALCILAICMLLGCTQRMFDFTIISSKNLDLSRAAEFTKGNERVEGKDTIYLILIFPTGIPNVKEAVDNAIEKVPGAVALLDGVVSFRQLFFILGGANSFIVEGTPLIDRSLISWQELPSNYMVSYYEPTKKEQIVVYLTKNEYCRVKNAIQRKDAKTIEGILLKQ